MRKILFSAVISLVCGPIAAYAADEPVWSPEQHEIIDLLRSGPVGVERDFSAWSKRYTDTWTVWFAGAPFARSKQDHLPLVRAFIDNGGAVISFDAQFTEIAINGDSAYASYNAIERLQNADGTQRAVHYAAGDFIVKTTDGWKIRASSVAFTSPPDNNTN